jgi:uncharacterized protein YihD (DUF1040 family)
MRDPSRIPEVIKELQSLWELNTDWRLGQLIANAVREVNGFQDDCDPFYIEDDSMLKAFKNLKELSL